MSLLLLLPLLLLSFPVLLLQNRKSGPLGPVLFAGSSLEPLACTVEYPVEYEVEQTPGVDLSDAERNGLASDELNDPSENV